MITNVFRTAYANYRSTPVLSTVAVLIYIAGVFLSNLVFRGAGSITDALWFALIVSLVTFVVNAYWQIGLVRYHLADGEDRKLALCFGGMRRLGSFLVLQISFGIVFILFALPGIGVMYVFPGSPVGFFFYAVALFAALYVLVRLVLSPWYVIAREQDPFDAMQHSWRATAGRFWPVCAVLILTGLLIVGGALVLLVGLLPAASVAIYAHRALFEECDAQLPQPRRRGSRN